MKKLHVRKGDTVQVLTGRDRGKQGEVLRTDPARGRVTVAKVNLVKKAMRPTQQNPQGGISTLEGTIDASDVMIVCPQCKKPTRVGHRRNDAGKSVRTCKKCGKDID